MIEQISHKDTKTQRTDGRAVVSLCAFVSSCETPQGTTRMDFKHVALHSLLLFGLVMFASDVVAADPTGSVVRFGTDVVPILTKLGCDSGGCHGKATGQNGFKLSLFGFRSEERRVGKECRL